MRMLRTLPALAMAASGATAGAEPWSCRFTVECPVGESCAEADRALSILPADHEGALFLSTRTADVRVTRATAEGARPAVYFGTGPEGSAHTVTIAGDGTALMTVHRAAPAITAVTHFGTCQEL